MHDKLNAIGIVRRKAKLVRPIGARPQRSILKGIHNDPDDLIHGHLQRRMRYGFQDIGWSGSVPELYRQAERLDKPNANISWQTVRTDRSEYRNPYDPAITCGILDDAIDFSIRGKIYNDIHQNSSDGTLHPLFRLPSWLPPMISL